MEPTFPLLSLVCPDCLLVQLEEQASAEDIFADDYAYFSSYSSGWLVHCESYVGECVERFGLDSASHVVELASNDGYMLQYYVERGISVLGVEPAKNVAEVAIDKGIPTLVEFFGVEVAAKLQKANLVMGSNVLAHVPDLHDFLGGVERVLAGQGVVTFEFPYLLRLIDEVQFDTIYHEHFSYFSLLSVSRALEEHGLRVFDVAEVPTHGGSLRLFACRKDDPRSDTERPGAMLAEEHRHGFDQLETYFEFAPRMDELKRETLSLLIELKNQGSSIVALGAAAKGNTLLNYCGIGTDFLDYVVDTIPFKQGRFLPGSRIPILSPEALRETKPDIVFILPWNVRDEIMDRFSYIREWGGRFAVRTPRFEVL